MWVPGFLTDTRTWCHMPGELCPASPREGGLTPGQEQLNRAPCCWYLASFNFLLGYLLKRDPAAAVRSPCMLGVRALRRRSFTFCLCCVRLAASINIFKCLLAVQSSSCSYTTEGSSHLFLQRAQRWHRKAVTISSSEGNLSKLMHSQRAASYIHIYI